MSDALLDKLLGDAPLMALMPDGVWWDVAKQGAQRFVVVSLVKERDDQMFRGRAFEDSSLRVKAVALSSTGADVKAAAARIDALLEGATLTIPGYNHLVLRRTARVRHTAVDEVDRSIRWQHRGGLYQLVVTDPAVV